MKQELLSGTIGTTLSIIGTAMQTNEILETISLVITILGGVITFIVVPILNWYRHAKKDGKIDADEIKEGLDIIVDGSERVKDEIDKGKEGK